jgi:virginiamycin B lyase
MWFTELAGRNIARIDPKGKIKEFPVPGQLGIAGITAGPDGNLWFTQPDISEVDTMSPTGDFGKTYSTLPYPFGITAGPDGNIWFCEGFGNAIGRIKPS